VIERFDEVERQERRNQAAVRTEERDKRAAYADDPIEEKYGEVPLIPG